MFSFPSDLFTFSSRPEVTVFFFSLFELDSELLWLELEDDEEDDEDDSDDEDELLSAVDDESPQPDAVSIAKAESRTAILLLSFIFRYPLYNIILKTKSCKLFTGRFNEFFTFLCCFAECSGEA